MKWLSNTRLYLVLCVGLQACADGELVSPERYARTDQFVSQVVSNVAEDASLQPVADIDHSRLGAEAGSPMPPARVVIFSDAQLESELIALDPLLGL